MSVVGSHSIEWNISIADKHECLRWIWTVCFYGKHEWNRTLGNKTLSGQMTKGNLKHTLLAWDQYAVWTFDLRSISEEVRTGFLIYFFFTWSPHSPLLPTSNTTTGKIYILGHAECNYVFDWFIHSHFSTSIYSFNLWLILILNS